MIRGKRRAAPEGCSASRPGPADGSSVRQMSVSAVASDPEGLTPSNPTPSDCEGLASSPRSMIGGGRGSIRSRARGGSGTDETAGVTRTGNGGAATGSTGGAAATGSGSKVCAVTTGSCTVSTACLIGGVSTDRVSTCGLSIGATRGSITSAAGRKAASATTTAGTTTAPAPPPAARGRIRTGGVGSASTRPLGRRLVPRRLGGLAHRLAGSVRIGRALSPVVSTLLHVPRIPSRRFAFRPVHGTAKKRRASGMPGAGLCKTRRHGPTP